jgi:hypothetical protein
MFPRMSAFPSLAVSLKYKDTWQLMASGLNRYRGKLPESARNN